MKEVYSYEDFLNSPGIDNNDLVELIVKTPTLQETGRENFDFYSKGFGRIHTELTGVKEKIESVYSEVFNTLTELGEGKTLIQRTAMAAEGILRNGIEISKALDIKQATLVVGVTHMAVQKLAALKIEGPNEKARKTIQTYIHYFAALQTFFIPFKTTTTFVALFPENVGAREIDFGIMIEAEDPEVLKKIQTKTLFETGTAPAIQTTKLGETFIILPPEEGQANP